MVWWSLASSTTGRSRDRRVERRRPRRRPLGSKRRVVAAALDPLEIGVRVRVGAHTLDDLVDRSGADERGLAELDASPQRVDVSVAEARHEAPSRQVELGGATRAPVERFVVERDDGSVRDRDRPRDEVGGGLR